MTHFTVAKATKQAMFPSALEIVQLLDQHIVGQRQAKEVLAKSVYRHFMLRAYADETNVEVDTRHKNILLIGPTGSGKTEVVRRLAKCLGIRFRSLPPGLIKPGRSSCFFIRKVRHRNICNE